MAIRSIHPHGIVRTLEEADRVLREMGRLKTRIQRIDQGARERMDRVRADAVRQSAPLEQRLRELETGLEGFARRARASLFRERRSVHLVFGSFGWRASTRLLPRSGKTWKQVQARIRELGLRQALRVKEEVDRGVLRKWEAADLERIGVRKVQAETFWYEARNDSVLGREAPLLADSRRTKTGS